MRFSARSVVTSLAFSSVAVAQLSSVAVPALPNPPIPIVGLQKLVTDLNVVVQDVASQKLLAAVTDLTLVGFDVAFLLKGSGNILTGSTLSTSDATDLVNGIVGTLCPQLAILRTIVRTLPIPISGSIVLSPLNILGNIISLTGGVLKVLPLGVDTTAATTCLNAAKLTKRSGGATIPIELAGL